MASTVAQRLTANICILDTKLCGLDVFDDAPFRPSTSLKRSEEKLLAAHLFDPLQ
jgi:hypothetical protein